MLGFTMALSITILLALLAVLLPCLYLRHCAAQDPTNSTGESDMPYWSYLSWSVFAAGGPVACGIKAIRIYNKGANADDPRRG